MNKYTIKGRVEDVGEIETKNSFTKRKVIIDNSTGNYPSPVTVTFKKDKVDLPDAAKVGDQVEIEFTIDGRRWDSPNGVKFFTDLNAWSLKVVQSAYTEPEPEPEPEAPTYPATGNGARQAFMDNGGAKSDFALFAQQTTGKKDSKSYTLADWVKVIAAAKKPNADLATADEDEMPF